MEEFQPVYEGLIQAKINSDALKREACWTESLAVGSLEFIEKVRTLSATPLSLPKRSWVNWLGCMVR